MSRSALGFDLKACADLRKVKENLTIVFSKFIAYFYKKTVSSVLLSTSTPEPEYQIPFWDLWSLTIPYRTVFFQALHVNLF